MICLRLLVHCMRRAASRAAWTAGRSRAINTAMIAMTTSSSISVKARRRAGEDGLIMAKVLVVNSLGCKLRTHIKTMDDRHKLQSWKGERMPISSVMEPTNGYSGMLFTRIMIHRPLPVQGSSRVNSH